MYSYRLGGSYSSRKGMYLPGSDGDQCLDVHGLLALAHSWGRLPQ